MLRPPAGTLHTPRNKSLATSSWMILLVQLRAAAFLHLASPAFAGAKGPTKARICCAHFFAPRTKGVTSKKSLSQRPEKCRSRGTDYLPREADFTAAFSGGGGLT